MIRLARRGVHTPFLVGTLLTEDEDELRTRLFFPLVHTNLSPVVAALARLVIPIPDVCGGWWPSAAARPVRRSPRIPPSGLRRGGRRLPCSAPRFR
jgi:hypothetical protein